MTSVPPQTFEDQKAGAAQVAAILRDRIVKGEINAGARLVERKLSAELDVSRTPVREALKLLEADGLIEISMHRGAVVSDFKPEDAVALFDVISMLEGLAAKRVCETLTYRGLQHLEDLHGTMMVHHQAGRTDDYFDTNTLIHDYIVDQAANPVLATTHDRLMTRARRGRYLAIMNPERLTQAVGEHDALMQAFRDRQPNRAAAIWEQHLRHTGESVTHALTKSDASYSAST